MLKRKKKRTALVTYVSKTGHTRQAAEDVARGLELGGVRAVVKSLSEVGRGELGDYRIVAVGSPTHGGKPARAVRNFFKGLGRKDFKGKVVTGFSAYAGMRGEHTVKGLRKQFKKHGAGKVVKGVAVKAGAPLSLWKGPDAAERDVARLIELGRALARKRR
jgi:flavodoxin